MLVVDDNKGVQSALELLLAPVCKSVNSICSPNQLVPILEAGSTDLILLDMNFSAGVNSGNEGLYWLRRIKEMNADIPVILITAYGDVELAVKRLKKAPPTLS
ncbi:MAG: response regulator [Bacteroidales bacterium]